MSISNSELLEELLIECYAKGIIDEVREEALKTMQKISNYVTLDVYQEAYEKIIKKYSEK